MTVPPGGPYGQNPYGPNPYGQDPSWGGQPPGGQPPQYQPPQYPPSGPYPQYQPPQPYPQTGPQQYAPGWPGGQYPPGPPPGGPGGSSKLPWIIVAAIAVVGVIGLVVLLVVNLNSDNSSTQASPTSTSLTPQPSGQQTASDCTPNVSGGDKPTGTTITAGKLSFATSTLPGWTVISDDQSPNLIDAVGLAREAPGANQWMMQAEVAITNFVPNMDIAAQASKLMACVAAGPGYSNAQPTLGPTKTSSITVDGVKAARVDADITIGDTARNVKGDTVVIIAVDTKPVTIFLGATPIGDSASADLINQVIGALKVVKS